MNKAFLNSPYEPFNLSFRNLVTHAELKQKNLKKRVYASNISDLMVCVSKLSIKPMVNGVRHKKSFKQKLHH